MYVILDRSRSLTYPDEAQACRLAHGADPSASDSSVCWGLFVGFTQAIANNLTQIKNMGWQGDKQYVWEGLRMNVIAFWCTNDQTSPKWKVIGQNMNNQSSFDQAMASARLMIPNDGTCPGQAIEQVVYAVQTNDLLVRPHKAAVLLTDGVMYDMPIPKLAAQGLAYFGVSTYALGIAMPQSASNTFGLSPFEVVRQHNQLLHFVNNNASRVFNFGQEGFGLLPVVAGQIASLLEKEIFGADEENTYWCGFTTLTKCTGPDGVGNGQYCKWMNYDGNWPGGDAYACKSKGFCQWNQATCIVDSTYCFWANGKCQTQPQYLQYT